MIVVPIDEDIAFTATALEELLRSIGDRIDGAARAVAAAAAVARAAEPLRVRTRVPVIDDIEQPPLSFLAEVAAADLVVPASEAIATDASAEVRDVVDEVGDRLCPGAASVAGGHQLRRNVGRLLMVIGIDHGHDLAILAELSRGPARPVHLSAPAIQAYQRVRARILAAWSPADGLAQFTTVVVATRGNGHLGLS